ncbi:Uncharacterised protein [[Eubacterium] contortum]|uniref:Uncharacterized protein n=1 Tax=Faecalicatena contorta TaxID=39482 RepID=A0A174NB89_9FIRM|nr:hypothetical protein [Faecalicatena contorta]CUP43848.1 Uncharacterised protein [[Eubacterium] contortum] [Faecalicatena contorta]
MAEQLPGQMSLNDFIPAPEPQKEKFDILNYIPVGSKNAVKRKRLCFLTGLIDRKMRNLLHEAGKKIPIINLQNGKGYFIPDMNTDTDRRMLIRWVKQEESRIRERQLCVDCAIRTLNNCCTDWRNEEYGRKTDVLEDDSGFRCVS